jgi:hypothetical protein
MGMYTKTDSNSNFKIKNQILKLNYCLQRNHYDFAYLMTCHPTIFCLWLAALAQFGQCSQLSWIKIRDCVTWWTGSSMIFMVDIDLAPCVSKMIGRAVVYLPFDSSLESPDQDDFINIKFIKINIFHPCMQRASGHPQGLHNMTYHI